MSKKKTNSTAKPWMSYVYVLMEGGKPFLLDGRLPFYWRKKVALDEAENFIGVTVKRIYLVIEP